MAMGVIFMDYKTFFHNLNDSLSDREMVERLVELFKKSYTREDFYNYIVRYGARQKNNKKIDIDAKGEFDAYVFNRWKNAFLNFDCDTIKIKAIKKSVLRIKESIKNGNVKNVDDVYSILKSDDLSNDIFAKKAMGKLLDKILFQCLRYDRSNNSVFNFYLSNYCLIGNDNEDIKHRYYINISPEYVHKFALYFLKKCDDENLSFEFKFGAVESRSDCFVIYVTDNNLLPYLNILRKIRKEHPELADYVYNPTILSSPVDGWIGYGSEPSNCNCGKSFNDVRSKLLYNIFKNMTNEWITQSLDKHLRVNGKIKKYKEHLIDRLCNSQLERLKSISKEYDNSLSGNIEFYIKYGMRISGVNSKSIYDKYYRFFDNNLKKILSNHYIKNLNTDLYISYMDIEKTINEQIEYMMMFESNFFDDFSKRFNCMGKKYNIASFNSSVDINVYDSIVGKNVKEPLEDSDLYWPGTNILKPRVRGINETEEEYNAFLKEYYDKYFGKDENTKKDDDDDDTLFDYLFYNDIQKKPRDRDIYETEEEYVEYLRQFYSKESSLKVYSKK